MTEQPGPPLTDLQAARLDYAQRDLGSARGTDLGQLEIAAIVLLINRLIMRLDDMIQLVDEISQASPKNGQ